MKKENQRLYQAILVLGLLMGACAQERNTAYEDQRIQSLKTKDSIRGKEQPLPAPNPSPSPSDTSSTCDLPGETSTDAASDSKTNATTDTSVAFIEKLSTKTDGENAQKLYDALNTEEVPIQKPSHILCEYIPQTRLEKSLGRLSCVKQYPTGSENQSDTHYSCEIKTSKDDYLNSYDVYLFNQINTSAVPNPNGYADHTTQTKRIGRFHCDEIVKNSDQVKRYECSVDLIYK